MTKRLSKAQIDYALRRIEDITRIAKEEVPKVTLTAGQLRSNGCRTTTRRQGCVHVVTPLHVPHSWNSTYLSV